MNFKQLEFLKSDTAFMSRVAYDTQVVRNNLGFWEVIVPEGVGSGSQWASLSKPCSTREQARMAQKRFREIASESYNAKQAGELPLWWLCSVA